MKVLDLTPLREEIALLWAGDPSEFLPHFHRVEIVGEDLQVTHYGLTYLIQPGYTAIVAERPIIFSPKKFSTRFRRSPSEYARQLLELQDPFALQNLIEEMLHDYS